MSQSQCAFVVVRLMASLELGRARRRTLAYSIPIITALALSASKQSHATTVIDFDGLSELTFVSTEFQAVGVSFNGPQVLTAGSALNELAFPPFSGTNVVINAQVPAIQANAFGANWSSAGGYVTGTDVVTLTAFAADLSVLGSVSTPGANFIGNSNGLLPNILLQLSFPNIAFVQFSPAGGNFTLDNFVFNAVPEPSSIALLGLGTLGLIRIARRRKA